MKRNIIIVSTLLIIILVAVANNTFATEKNEVELKQLEINRKENIVLLGDSIFDWYPTEEIFDDYPIVNSGIAGNVTQSILDSLETRVYRYNPTKVFILIGTNDIEWDDSEELNNQVANNIIEIAKRIREKRNKSEVFILSILPVNNNLSGAHDRHISEIKTINTMLEKYCENADKVTYINVFDELKNSEEMLKTSYTEDGLHLNNLGYAKLTKIIMKYIY